MFERLWLKDELENKYFHVFLFGVTFTIISLLLTNYILPIKNGLVAVFLISLASAYPLVAYLNSIILFKELKYNLYPFK